MNTAVLKEKETLCMEQRGRPRLRPGEVLVEVAYCGVCRTDRKAYQEGQRDLRLPRVLGHEFAGTIAEIGPGVTGFALGERVQVHPGIGCGSCVDCLNGDDQRCTGMKILGFHLDGGFSRYCRIPADGVKERIINKVPDEVRLYYAALSEPISCALHMLDHIELKSDDKLLIVGGGVLGCIMAKLCRYFKIAENILMVEPNEKKRSLCAKMGFTALPVKNAEVNIGELWPQGADAAIPCCPVNFGMELSLKVLKNGGKLGFFSGLRGKTPMTHKLLNLIHYKELTVTGAYGCGLKDGQKALELLTKGFDLSDLPITFIGLHDVEATLKQRETEDDLITMIRYEKEIG